MCIGKSKSSNNQQPAAPAPVANPNNSADNSANAQRQAVVASQTPPTPSFGSELGAAGSTTQ